MRSLCAGITLLLVVACSVAAGDDITSPHGLDQGCGDCHTERDGKIEGANFRGGAADQACATCHRVSHHAVGMTPETVVVPADMPLDGGLMACFTCHDEPACDAKPEPNRQTGGRQTGDRQPERQLQLRGGPYPQAGQLCSKCHVETAQERYNPHQEMVENPDERESCAYCHPTDPTPGGSALRVDGPNQCAGCHRGSPHAGASHHAGTVDADMASSADRAGLPLAQGRRMVCLTCHDPHPAGRLDRSSGRASPVGAPLFPPRWASQVLAPALADRHPGAAPVAIEPDFLRRPLAGGDLCTSCHTPKRIDDSRNQPLHGKK